ncbi:MAG TPA: outer membrane lipoprotein carrier protein LolA [Spirochaetia bacterium]
MNSRTALFILFVLLLPFAAFAQGTELVSAEKYFSALSAKYGTIKDYEAVVSIAEGKVSYHGALSYKSPMFLRIDFDDPPKMVLCFDGKKLIWFSPQNEVVLEQDYKKKSNAQIEGMATSQGLILLQRNYSIAFLNATGAEPVPLEEGSREMVSKLKLVSRGATSYSQLIISVKDNLIRRVEGTQTNGEKVVMDFTNIRTNQGIPDSRFVYDSPPYANVIQDWLFDPEE